MSTYETYLYFSCVIFLTLSALQLMQYRFETGRRRNPRPTFLWSAVAVSIFGMASVMYSNKEMFPWPY